MKLLFTFLIAFTLAGVASAQTAERRAALLEKLAYSLTGKQASDVIALETRQAYFAGQTSLAAIANQLKTRDEFVQRLADYYTQEFKFGQKVNWTEIIYPDGGPTYTNIPKSLYNYIRGATYWGPKAASHNVTTACDTGGYTGGIIQIPSGGTVTTSSCHTDCSKTKLVRPYWNPAVEIKICQDVDLPANCGENLGLCLPPTGSYVNDISYAFTIEPGVMAAKIIADERSWGDLVTTTQGVVNGPLADVMRRFATTMLAVFPPGSYPTRNTDPVFTSADPTNLKSWHWIERGPGHAGIFTTPAFHRTTNGWRAKANRTMQSLLCREFKAADGSVPVTSDETDLTKKPYCSQCHITLEPMARFFSRWPDVGNDNNFFYDVDSPKDPNGAFNGKAGSDTPGFGAIVADMDAYSQCAVEKAFKFVVGRQMNAYELENYLPPLMSKFKSNGKRVFPIMRDIIESPVFKGGQ